MVAAILVAACAAPSPTRSDARPSPSPLDLPTSGLTPAAPGTTATPSAVPPASQPAGEQWEPVQATLLEPVATLDPTHTVPAGVVVDSAFRLASLTGEDAVVLAAGVSADPEVSLAVAGADDGSAILTPREPLRRGTLYRFSLSAPDGTLRTSWAVETVDDLRIVNTVPEDTSERVPVDAGIEVTFNEDGVRLADAERYASLEPAVPGHFEMAARTLAFVPDQPLATGTRYTFTVRRGLPLAGTGEVLADDYAIQFATSGWTRPDVRVLFTRTLVETGTASPAVFPVHVGVQTDDDEKPVVPPPTRTAITVHRLPDIETAIGDWQLLSDYWWDTTSDEAKIDTTGLPLVVDATVRLRSYGAAEHEWEESSEDRWLELPAPLPAGWYVATIRLPGSSSQAVLQATDVAVYTLATSTRSVVWVNDLRTKQPLKGASVTLAGKAAGSTGADGLLIADTPVTVVEAGQIDDAVPPDEPVAVVRDGTRAAFVPAAGVACDKCSSGGDPHPWWRLLELDRWRYRTTDTVSAWGVIRSRTNGAIPSSVSLEIVTWDDGEESDLSIAKATPTPDGTGAFMAQLPLADVPPGDYSVRLTADGLLVSEQSFTVGEILKPAWILDLALGRHAVVAGKKVTAAVKASFFEGTPVAGARLVVGQRAPRVRTSTGTDGASEVQVTIRSRSANSWDVEDGWWVDSVDARPVDPQEAQINASAQVAVFPAAVVVKADAIASASKLTVSGTVHDVAFARFEAPSAGDLSTVDPYGRLRAGSRVRVAVEEHVYATTRVGSAYDFISKRTIPVYRTTERTVSLGTREVRTDGKGRYRVQFPVGDSTHDFRVTVSAYDTQGRRTQVERWATVPTRAGRPEIGASLERLGAGPDDAIRLGGSATVAFAGGAGRSAASRYLWIVAQSGLRSTSITSKPRVALKFREAWVPAAYVQGVRFTGSGYEVPGNQVRLPFQVEDRRLAVSLTTDKPRYRPGDTVTVSVRVRDASGSGLRASVYLRAIDEKLFAANAAGMSDPLEGLYADTGPAIVGINWTHRDPRPDRGGGAGDATGGGGERSDFRDWLINRLVRTDARGRATVSFAVSDDLTSWRIIGEAVTPDLEAGFGAVKIPVTIPFFADLTLAPSYLVSDRPILVARAFGGGLGSDTKTRFTFSSDSLPMPATTVEVRGFTPAEVSLPPLTAGRHTIRVEATTGSGASAQRDLLVRTFEVVESTANQVTSASAVLDGVTPVATGPGFTTLVLSDGGRGRVVPVLEELLQAPAIRADGALAATLARRVLASGFGLDDGGSAPPIDGFIAWDGVAPVPWGGGDPELSTLAAMTGDPLARRRLASYFVDAGAANREYTLLRLAGLAAVGEPALADIRAWMTVRDLDVREETALALALVAAGDEATARALEARIISTHAERYGPWVRIADRNAEMSALDTARVAILAAFLGDPLAAGMDAYVVANPPKSKSLDLERALAAAEWAQRVPPADARVALTLQGTRREIALQAGHATSVVLTPQQAATASLEPVSGTVLVTTRHEEPVDAGALEPVSGLAISRTVAPSGAVKASDLVKVTLQVSLPAGDAECWMVTETVPSGLRPIVGTSDQDDEDGEPRSQPWDVEGQRLQYCVQRDDSGRPGVTITYLARVLTPGTYTWEPAVIQSALAPDHGTTLPATTLEVRGLTAG